MRLTILVAIQVFLALVAGVSGHAAAEQYPAKPIRWVVPFPPGGPLDVMARLVGQRMAEQLGQPVVIENRAGANGIIGTEAVVRAAPDGYMLLSGSVATITINPSMHRLSFDPAKDLAPVTQMLRGSFVLIVKRSFPASSVREFLTLAQSKPGKLNYASYGIGSSPHLAMELLKREAKVDLVHVPYKGTGPAMADLMSGHVDIMFDAPITAIPQLQAGVVKALAVSTPKRLAALPNVPALAETFPGFNADGWQGVFVPAGTPKEIIATLNREIVKILRAPDIQKRISDLGQELVAGAPQELSEKVRFDTALWARVIKEAGIKAE